MTSLSCITDDAWALLCLLIWPTLAHCPFSFSHNLKIFYHQKKPASDESKNFVSIQKLKRCDCGCIDQTLHDFCSIFQSSSKKILWDYSCLIKFENIRKIPIPCSFSTCNCYQAIRPINRTKKSLQYFGLNFKNTPYSYQIMKYLEYRKQELKIS